MSKVVDVGPGRRAQKEYQVWLRDLGSVVEKEKLYVGEVVLSRTDDSGPRDAVVMKQADARNYGQPCAEAKVK